MKISAPVAAFDAAMSKAAMAAEKKLDTPLYIVAGNGSVAFSVANPRTAIAIKATTSASIGEPGKLAISAWRFAALLSGCPSRSTITISVTAKQMTIACGGTYRLPLLPVPPGGLVINPEIGRADLATADCLRLFEVLAAAGTEKARFYLNGVFMHNVGGRLTALGMDGAKVLRVSVAADDVLSTDDRLIVPTPTVTMLTRLLRQTKPDRVLLRRSRTVFSAIAPGFEITSGLIDAAYPDYRAVLPNAGTDVASCQRAELLGALARLKAIAAGEMPLIALTWANGEPLRVFLARQPDAGTDPIVAQTRGSARKAFALAQLMAMISEFSDTAILLEAADRGLVIRQGDKFGALMACAWHEREVAA